MPTSHTLSVRASKSDGRTDGMGDSTGGTVGNGCASRRPAVCLSGNPGPGGSRS